jgi:hypothetical protein
MSWQRVEKLSETTLQILCGKCIKEARIIWAQQAGIDNNHMLLVECHGEPRMVIVNGYNVRVRKSENAPLERLQLTWESLQDFESDYLEQIRAAAEAVLEGARERLENIELFNRMKVAGPGKRATRFEALADELEDR